MTVGVKESALVGIVFGGVNLWLLARIVIGLTRSASSHTKHWKTGLFFLLKMVLLALTLGLILWKGYVTPLPFLGGFTVSLIVGLTVVILKGKRHDA